MAHPGAARPPAVRCYDFALARVRAAFLAAVLRCAALRLRVAAAFLAAAWRFAGPPLARSSRSATILRRSVIRAVAALPGPEPLALVRACERSRATRLRIPFARRRSNRASAWDFAIDGLLSTSERGCSFPNTREAETLTSGAAPSTAAPRLRPP